MVELVVGGPYRPSRFWSSSSPKVLVELVAEVLVEHVAEVLVDARKSIGVIPCKHRLIASSGWPSSGWPAVVKLSQHMATISVTRSSKVDCKLRLNRQS